MLLLILLILLAKMPYERPWGPAAVYSTVVFLFGVVSGDLGNALIQTGVGFFASLLYFGVMKRLSDSVVLWIIAVIVGAFLVQVIGNFAVQ